MSAIRLIVTDLDFTLLNEQFDLSETTKSILQKLLEHGIEIVPCSSRPLSEIPQWFREQENIHWLVTANGGAIIDNQSGETLCSNTMSSAKAKHLLTLSEDINPYWSCLIDGRLHSHLAILDDREALAIDGDYLENILKQRIWESSKDFLDAYADAQIAKIHFITDQEYFKTKQSLMDRFAKEEGIAITSSHPVNVEIVHPNANKGAALKWLMKKLDCTRAEVMACGDNANDLSMLKEAAYSVAVANATKEVLAAARYHAPSYKEDGAAKMMEQLVFQEQNDMAD